MKNKILSSCLVLIAAVGTMVHVSAQGQEPTRAITNITGDLYRAQNNAHFTVFLVTSEGIILADPIGTEFATWLKAELADRYDVPVRYVLYSHYHDDHASGGDLFADTAQFIGHENMPVNLAREEGNEIFAEVRAPDLTYSDRLTVTLGGKTVEMIHAMPSHSDDSTILRFLDERAIFGVDFINVRRLPFQDFRGGPVAPWIEANRRLQTIDYDIVAPGHGDVGTKADIDDSTRYLEELLAAVTAGIAAGQSLDQLQQSVMMEDYKDWGQYEAWRAQNVQGTYQGLTNN